MHAQFEDYAQYYSAFYQDKPYREEAEYVRMLIGEERGELGHDWVDLGCGSGGHSIFFAEAGWQVHGVDASIGMIEQARKRAPGLKFTHATLQNFRLPEPARVASSLFHVMSYQTSDDDLFQALRNVRANLAKDGWFLFDFWHGPGVFNDPPTTRSRRLKYEGKELTRIAKPDWQPVENRIDVHYELLVRDQDSGETTSVKECHAMRYFFVPEIRQYLTQTGFRVERICRWKSSAPLESDDWYGMVVARAC